jgi:hypothetical protein
MSKVELLYQRHLDKLRESASEKNILFVDALMAVYSPLEKNALLALLLRGKDTPKAEESLIQRYRLEFFEWIANNAIDINEAAIEAMANNKAKEIISTAQKEASKKGGDAKAAKLKKPKDELRQVWAMGNYTNRDICAEEEYSSQGFNSFKTARNALKGTPNPDPWPAKVKNKK